MLEGAKNVRPLDLSDVVATHVLRRRWHRIKGYRGGHDVVL